MAEGVFAIVEWQALCGADRERQQAKQRERARSLHAKPVVIPCDQHSLSQPCAAGSTARRDMPRPAFELMPD